MRGFAVVVVAGVVATADAHHSASQGGRLYRERYLECTGVDAGDRWRCVGPDRARAPLIRALDATDHPDAARSAAVWAAYFHVRDAVAPIRGWLGQKLEAAERHDHRLFDKQGLRAEAAFALARLGDIASAPAIAALVREFETDGYGSLWADTLAALRELDPARASSYAIDFVGRQTDFVTSMPGGSSKLVALDAIRGDDAARANPVLAKLAKREEHGDDHAYCEIMATRVRLDPAVHAATRDLFVASYSGTWLAGCAESVMRRFGGEVLDADAIVRHLGRDDTGMDFGMANLSYQRLLDLEVALVDRKDQLAADVRTILHAGLGERSKSPHVTDPTHANYSLHFVALHMAALAAVGDAAAARKLETLVVDPKDTSGVAWLASLYDLRLGRPGSLDRAAALLARGTRYANTERTGSIFEGLRIRVLDAFVARAPDDGRWAASLIDAEPDVAEHALDLVARIRPKHACEAVTAAAKGASGHAAEFAFLALTSLGTSCVPALDALAASHDTPPEVRGAAIEILAALGDSNVCELRHDGVSAAALARARQLHACSP